ncbi:MAG: carbohydrate ABC transporter substrate-binding protein [Clostridiales bacterium]|nr:carbohydrate ABC transporter substrate-binding protein [Clostridiales bacterium]
MKRSLTRGSCVMLSLALSAGLMLSGCNKPSGNGKKVSAGDPWYDSRVVELGDQYEDSGFDDIYFNVIGCLNGYVVVNVNGYRDLPSDFDWENDDYSLYNMNNYDFYDLNGELANSLSADDLLEGTGLSPDSSWLNDVTPVGDRFLVTISTWDGEEDTRYEGYIEIPSGEISDLHEVEADTDIEEDSSFEGTTVIGDYSIEKYWLYSDDDFYSYILKITDASGRVTQLDLREEVSDLSIFDIPSFLYMGGSDVLVPCSCTESQEYLILSLEDMTISKGGDDLAWLDDSIVYNSQYIDGLGCITKSGTGIKLVDFENKTTEEILNFGWTYQNVSDLSGLAVLSYEDDSIVMGGTIWEPSYSDYSERCLIVILNKAERNPNAGKSIIDVAFIDYVDRVSAQAICDFNSSSEDCFIRYDERYYISDFEENLSDYEGIDWTQHDLDARASMSNQLAIDLLAGDGPDIIFNAIALSQLDTDQYLVDLSDVITGGDYYGNIIDMCRTDGKLYQVPLNFSMQGILVSASDVDDSQTGFTYDEYVRFVDEVCNGTDPLNMDKLECFTRLMSCLNDQFISSGGQVDYNNSDFRDLADFVSEHINYVEYDDDYMDGSYYFGAVGSIYRGQLARVLPDLMNDPGSSFTPRYTMVGSFGYYLDTLENDMSGAGEIRLLGLPSSDGRGPSVEVGYSVAVSSSSEMIDGCKDFIRVLFNQDTQEGYARIGATPVLRSAFDSTARRDLDAYNASVDRNLEYYSEAELREWGLSRNHIDESAITNYTHFIESCSCLVQGDPAVMSIIREEIPAYFEGQKTIDEVIDIMQDRVQTFINERG